MTPPALPTDLTGRVVFVAGGGSAGPGWSIGRAASVTYARQGARVCVADRDAASAEETCALIRAEGGDAEVFVGDVALEADVQRLFAEARARFGPIDVLHHNVGIGKTGGPLETSAEDLDRIHAVNVRSLLLATQQVLPDMLARAARASRCPWAAWARPGTWRTPARSWPATRRPTSRAPSWWWTAG